MKRFVEGEDRQQATLLPACLEDNPVRVIDVFIDELDLEALGCAGGDRAARLSSRDTAKDRSGRIYPGLCCCAGLAFDPANKLEALAVFRKNLPNISEDLANKSYEIMLSSDKGFHAPRRARRGRREDGA